MVVVPHIVEGKPLISWLILRGSVTVLKQFTTVSMTIQNLSDEPFKLTHGSATLTLPAGLSLAPIAAPQSLSGARSPKFPAKAVPVPHGSCGETRRAATTCRADYQGQLEPFESAVDIPACGRRTVQRLRQGNAEA